mgnify:CR=1 FL=1
MEDVEHLIEEANKREIGLMFDMVFTIRPQNMNGFKNALAGDPKYMDYYIFKDGIPDQPPTNWQSKFGGMPGNTYLALKKYYLHLI